MKTINYTPKELDVETVKTRRFDSFYFVYCLRSAETKEIVYVGKTNRILDTRNRHQHNMDAYNLNLEIIAECYCDEIAVFIEDSFLKKLDRNSLYLNTLIPKI